MIRYLLPLLTACSGGVAVFDADEPVEPVDLCAAVGQYVEDHQDWIIGELTEVVEDESRVLDAYVSECPEGPTHGGGTVRQLATVVYRMGNCMTGYAEVRCRFADDGETIEACRFWQILEQPAGLFGNCNSQQ